MKLPVLYVSLFAAASLGACGPDPVAGVPEPVRADFAAACVSYYDAGFETIAAGKTTDEHCACVLDGIGDMFGELGIPSEFATERLLGQADNYRTGLRKREVMGLGMPGYDSDSLIFEAGASPNCK